jgi:hypothetical protein
VAIIPHAFAFSAKFFEFDLTDALSFFEEKDLDPEIDDKMKMGFTKFLDSLNWYLDQIPNLISATKSKVNIFGSVTLENGAIVRAISKYYNKPWFSNVSVRMNPDESSEYISDLGICYGQVTGLFINC